MRLERRGTGMGEHRRRDATIVDVAARAGVSKSLVSLVVRGAGNVSAEKRAAVRVAMRELGYRPNAVAQSLVRRRSDLIGVMVSDLQNPYFTEVIEGIEEAAIAAEYRALFNSGSRLAKQEAVAIDTLLQLRTDGLILAGTIVARAAIEAAARVVPTVLITRTVRSHVVDVVVNDDARGAHLAIGHLVSLRHRRIAHVDGGGGAGAQRRARAYRDAMRRHGLGEHIRVAAGAYTEDGGAAGVRELLSAGPRPTAIFAANDLAALGALYALADHGLRVPEDVSLVGYDNTALARLRHVDLTTINQPRRDMGRRAVELLLDRLDTGRTEGRQIVVEPNLVVGSTTARAVRQRSTHRRDD